ncbi:MAG: carotenoid biosynthesis protein [Crocinitomix sp.]|nr:carotenoid biosynthesis protein [Crocinitomix sp.]
MRAKLSLYFPLVLVIFHIIGFVLFTQSDSASDLTWFNLLLCGTLVFLAEANLKKAAIIFIIIFLGGFLIELVGTKSGVLFGNYHYGDVLGWKLFGVSIIIGVNWFAIVLAASNVARLFKVPILVQAILGGILCVALDFAIEPVAIKYGFWTWAGGEIPFFNYVTWFGFAAIFSYIYLKSSAVINKTAVWLFGVWLLFFMALNFI